MSGNHRFRYFRLWEHIRDVHSLQRANSIQMMQQKQVEKQRGGSALISIFFGQASTIACASKDRDDTVKLSVRQCVGVKMGKFACRGVPPMQLATTSRNFDVKVKAMTPCISELADGCCRHALRQLSGLPSTRVHTKMQAL